MLLHSAMQWSCTADQRSSRLNSKATANSWSTIVVPRNCLLYISQVSLQTLILTGGKGSNLAKNMVRLYNNNLSWKRQTNPLAQITCSSVVAQKGITNSKSCIAHTEFSGLSQYSQTCMKYWVQHFKVLKITGSFLHVSLVLRNCALMLNWALTYSKCVCIHAYSNR